MSFIPPTPQKRWLFWIVVIAAGGYLADRLLSSSDYPDAWPAPALFAGWRGGCPDLSGDYDGVGIDVPRLLTRAPYHEKGARVWFEHKASVTQAADGSTLRITFALNERGLPRHRDHVLQHQVAWPSGHAIVLELTRREHYDCRVRWLSLDAAVNQDDKDPDGGRLWISVDRAGNFIVRHTKKRWTSFGSFFGQSIGPSWQADHHKWYRWTRRPPEADNALRAVQSLAVVRQKWFAAYGKRQLITLGNFVGEDVCTRLWDQAGPDPDRPGAGILNTSRTLGPRKRLPDGSVVTERPCPEGWEWQRATAFSNYFVAWDDGTQHDWRVAFRPLARLDSTPVVIELGDVNLLAQPDAP